ncbi:hypothetical protein JCM10213_005086 [Rhodosporidiobolus nylandii]
MSPAPKRLPSPERLPSLPHSLRGPRHPPRHPHPQPAQELVPRQSHAHLSRTQQDPPPAPDTTPTQSATVDPLILRFRKQLVTARLNAERAEGPEAKAEAEHTLALTKGALELFERICG